MIMEHGLRLSFFICTFQTKLANDIKWIYNNHINGAKTMHIKHANVVKTPNDAMISGVKTPNKKARRKGVRCECIKVKSHKVQTAHNRKSRQKRRM